jgi:hypothetical protein
MFHRLAVHGIADHFRKRGDAWIFGDEAVVPAFLRGADQHQFEPALPDDASAQPFEHRSAFPSIGRISFGAGCLAAIGIGRVFPQTYQIEHVDRPWPIIGPELRENFLGRIDVAHAALLVTFCFLITRRPTS